MADDELLFWAPATLRPLRLAATTLVVALAVFGAARVSIALPRDGMLAPIWLANAVVVAVMAVTDRKAWPWLVLAAVLANLAALAYGHAKLLSAICLVPSNAIEYLLASQLLRSWTKGVPDLTRARAMVQLAIVCALAGAASAIASSISMGLLGGIKVWPNLQAWSLAHILGLLTVTPCLMIVMQPRRYLGDTRLGWRSAGACAVLVAATLGVFSQSRFPILFLIPPALVLVSLELETFGAAAGVLTVEAVAIASLFLRCGPMMLIKGTPTDKAAIVQIFLISALAISIPVAALNARRRQAAAIALKSETKYRLLAENASDMIVQFTPTGVITFVTPCCQDILGYAAEALIGRNAIEMTHPDDVDRVAEYFQTLRRTRSALDQALQLRVKKQTGEWVWLEGRPRMFFDAATGEPTAMQDVLRDVTRRKAMEFELEQAQLAAEAASRVKSEFLSNMSHELRTPLTSIVGFAALLQHEDGLSDLTRRSVERISGSSQALLAIVNDILDFSKLEAGQVDIEARPTDLNRLLSETVAMLELQADEKQLTLTFSAKDLPAAGLVDGARIRQVLLNIIGNAVKFTAAGSVTLDVTYDTTTQRLRCEVIDTGEGISEAGLTRLFQRFSQVDASTTRVHGGTGLGLAICKGLVEAMQGDIGAVSVLGQGSTFWFELPCPAAAEMLAEPGAEVENGSDLDGLRILLADDNPINREIVRLRLSRCGVQLTEAASGEEAIELAQTAPFDMILMDVRMPGLDGGAAARAIRSTPGPNDMIPILAFTADVLDDFAGRSEDYPFDDRVAKPIVPADLFAVLSRWAYAEIQAPDAVQNQDFN